MDKEGCVDMSCIFLVVLRLWWVLQEVLLFVCRKKVTVIVILLRIV